VKLFFDGACRPNPGPMETAVVARGQVYHRPGLGQGSSQQAEWLALLQAVELAGNLKLRDVLLLGDSVAIVRQANGILKCPDPALLTAYREAIGHFARVRLRHVKRTQNLAGIALEKIRDTDGMAGVNALSGRAHPAPR